MLPLCDFLYYPVLTFFLGHAPGSNRWTDFHTLWLKRRVSVQGGAFWGLGRLVTLRNIWGKYVPKTPKGGSRQFQAKTPKYKNRNISETTSPLKTKFEDQA